MRLQLLALLMFAAAAQVYAEEPAVVSSIRFVGNEVTREKVMLREMVIHAGDPIDSERIEKSRQAIMNLGLFKSVTANIEEGNVLVITVVERYYVLPLPLLDIRPTGDYNFGGDIRFDNVAGLNQHLKLTYEENSSVGSKLPRSKEGDVVYSYPRIADTAYEVDFVSSYKKLYSLTTNTDKAQSYYRINQWSSSLGASRWANDEGISRGWRYGGGINYLVNKFHYIDGATTDGFTDGQAVSLFTGIDYLNVDDHIYYRSGDTYGLHGEVGGPYLGSNFSFSREQAYYRAYHHFDSSGANVNSQWQLGLANGCAFGCTAWQLGGSSTLRGYNSNYVSGNVFALINLEYHYPLSGFKQFRGVVFTDIGDAWSDLESVRLGHPKSSAGIGFRWTVQSFVNLTLRFDYAYALDAQTYHAYFSTSASF